MRNVKRQLQIRQLSANGQLLNCVNCFSGQVSVLRTSTASAIQPYMNALAGIPGPEKFVIEYDNEPYIPHKNTLIGFGERFVSTDGTVEEFLLKNKIPENLIKSLLISFGLENLRDQACSRLTRCEERRVRLIAAVYDSEKILVINDPFDPISSEWRERFAELLVNSARTKSQIIIITYLSNRPECWIDNEYIARIQVGDAIQKTIGFTNQASNIQAMINQIRDDHKEDAKENIPVISEKVEKPILKEPEPIKPENKIYYIPKLGPVKNFYLKHANKIAATFVAFIIVFFLSSYGDRKNAELLSKNTKAPSITKPETVILDNEISNTAKVNLPDSKVSGDMVVDPDTELNTQVRSALVMRYPQNIQSAILKAVSMNSGSTTKRELPQVESQKVKENKEASDFLKLLATTASNQPDGASSNDTDMSSSASFSDYTESDYNNQDVSNEQARREQIRQKFLEAIQRAQERSQ